MSNLFEVPIEVREVGIEGIPTMDLKYVPSVMMIDPSEVGCCHPDGGNTCIMKHKGCDATTTIYWSYEKFCEAWEINR